LTDFRAWENFATRLGPLSQLFEWLDSLPHPSVVVEIAQNHVAAARWDAQGRKLEGHAIEEIPVGAIQPSAVEGNVANADAVRAALSVVLGRLGGGWGDVALLVPDPVVRVFILPFENFPRRAEEAIPMLRFRLKKSVPFDVEETVVSSMRQIGKDGGLEVVAALARQRVLREYEFLAETAGLAPGVILSSSLASLPLLDAQGATLMVRVSGRHLTTVIVHGQTLCVYRSSEMASSVASLPLPPPIGSSLQSPLQPMMDEIFPAVAYYQDTWNGNLERVRLAGFGSREAEMREMLKRELNCGVLALGEGADGLVLPEQASGLLSQNLEGLVGWGLERRV
jgi:Tfp pilus assembly PilM family ATPase